MSAEPGIVDANVLVYAFDRNAPWHSASLALLDAARTGATTLYVTSQVLCEFYSIVTNPRRVLKPRTVADAIAAITDLLSFLHVLPIPARTVEGWPDLLRRLPWVEQTSSVCYWGFYTSEPDGLRRHARERCAPHLHVQHRRFRRLRGSGRR